MILSCSMVFGVSTTTVHHVIVTHIKDSLQLKLKVAQFRVEDIECEIPNEKPVHTISFFPFSLFAPLSTTSLVNLTQKSGIRSSSVLKLQQCFLHTHFWHMWIKFYCSVNSFYCIHLCSTQPSP